MAMKVLPAVRRDIDVESVVNAELASYNKLMPPRWGDWSLRGHEEAVADWLRSLMRRDFPVDPEQIVLSRKLGRGGRPCSLLGLKERLIYRGAVSLVENIVGSPDRSQPAYEEFQEGPLSADDCRYVLKADVASYYQFIDHERLVDEVVAQTGDDLAVGVAVELLSTVSGRSFGLPQLSSVSDVLGDIYIDPMRRALLRAGFSVWHFADDFRVACASYEDALAALEVADHAARELGLVLNEMKTSTPRIDKYRESLTALLDRERELFDELEVEALAEPDAEEYGEDALFGALDRESLLDEDDFDEGDLAEIHNGESEYEEISDAQLLAASRVTDLWVREDEDDDVQRSERAHVTAKILGRALRVFTLGRDPSALEHTASILVYEPSLTPTVARYLRACGRFARTETRQALDDVCTSGIVSTWQAIWIAYAAGELPPRRPRRRIPHVEWLREQCRSSDPALRAEAAMALARRRLASSAELLNISAGLPEMHRPTLLLAMVANGNEGEANATADSELDRLRIEWASERL